MTFFNTNRESGPELAESRRKAKNQEDLILDHFKAHPDRGYTPFEIRDALVDLRYTPITSIRRAMTNLTDRGELEKPKTDQKVERYGKKNHLWRLAVGEGQLSIL